MNVRLQENADAVYQLAEKKAAEYFATLCEQLSNQIYATTLTKDIQAWKQNHIHHYSLFSRGKRKSHSLGYHRYLHWLNHSGKLDSYLDRSISYIFLRDLGKSLHSPETQSRIQLIVADLKEHLMHSSENGGKAEIFSMAGLYRWAQKEGVETTVIWLLNKLKVVSSIIPEGMDADEAKRKLSKIVAGVVLHQMEEMGEEIPAEVRARRLDEAIRLGYSYGLTYPFIDDLLDSDVLSDEEKRQYSDLIRSTLMTGFVPELKNWAGENEELIRSIHSELCDAFAYIEDHIQQETKADFLEQSYVFFQSQEVDREKNILDATYTNEDLYVPVILKSASSRLMARSILSVEEDNGFDKRTFFYGIYNQLADDFADMFEDLKAGAVTPYTYYMKYHTTRPDLINPYELYWTVICHLIHNVYDSDKKTCDVMLNRAVNGLKRFKERMGDETYNEVMRVFATGHSTFDRLIQKMVRKADDVEFFDKLLRDHMIANFKAKAKEQEAFLETIDALRGQINAALHIPEDGSESFLEEAVIEAANYSLQGDGKRLRPIMTWVMGVHEYGLDPSAIMPLLKSLEYMHTASLIFDDLPSQDNSSFRRGRPTVHHVYNTAVAELAGLYLSQKAVEEQASLDQFNSQAVLRLIRYSAGVTTEMCKGQAMDLNSKGRQLTLDQLHTMCFYKTGLAFEATLVMPAILAGKQESELEGLKRFAYHAGIAFQIKDDLLDIEGDMASLGKPTGKDAENNHSTFVSVLGANGARKAMWDHYCTAMELLQQMHHKTSYLEHFLSYIVNRDN
ncbi:hypothetical protein NCCP2222_25310 [Sporosarcina sp. NCCP-2222]|uniref:polyprenyl synthetase family protein n=1 Tax=Sporosarcina sp. NCCP-2222 TaxID=2935073 RepID=UPI002088C862|nr:polyprenyl synthetase family protein [Sporosarcina sp. NCCP-2222]GKV56584.1 hypothetical protein NCCP2222_25310 [Sporosarcina sp. NCCP-2222]